jgi:hypothetical protein
MFVTVRKQNRTGAGNVGNSTSSAPACVGAQVSRPESGKLKSGKNFRKNSILRGLLFALGVAFGGAGQNLLGDQAGVLADRDFDLRGHVGIGFQERL